MSKSRRRGTLREAYSFPGFVPTLTLRGIFGKPLARVLRLQRRQKKQPAGSVAAGTGVTMTESGSGSAICPVGPWTFTWSWKFAGWPVSGVAR